jgi:hypothetical protein
MTLPSISLVEISVGFRTDGDHALRAVFSSDGACVAFMRTVLARD